jgi:benzodiazapine receptor
MEKRDLLPLVLFLGVAFAVEGVSGLSTASSLNTWYAHLEKPAWTPPGAVFGPVWTVLYATIGVAGWLVHRAPRGRSRTRALAVWWAQLALNLLWSPVFFLLRSPGPALAVLALLWLAIAAWMGAASRVRRSAAWLLLPYLAWVSFATALNAAIWRLNRGSP